MRLPFAVFRLLFDFKKTCSSHRREPGQAEIADRYVFPFTCIQLQFCRPDKTNKKDNNKAVRAHGIIDNIAEHEASLQFVLDPCGFFSKAFTS